MAKFEKILRGGFWASVLMGVAGLSGLFGIGCVVAWQVFLGDDSELKKSTILAKIKEETSLYYLDGQTRIGSIFESQHRRYIPIEEVPQHVNNALIAAEDENFYSHVGVDPFAIAKAVTEGIANGGRFRRGGSTITQQTVKNIMDDWEASFARKFREMIKAMQLERLYTKRQILEFYLNQFHVAGNGNGIGIAAKYYFDKSVSELDLVEGAFIAGSVKGPGKYNPFIKYTKQARAEALAFANERKNYVLRRMYEQNWITEAQFKDGVAKDVPFNKGEFRTSEVALVELIKSELKRPEILEALKLNSSEDLNVAGLKVYTTLDQDLQRVSQLAMRQNLSRLETTLKGFKPEPKEEFRVLRSIAKEEFYYAKVVSISGDKPENTQIHVTMGLPNGIIPAESLTRYAKLLDLSEGVVGGWQEQVKRLRQKIKIGDILYVEVKSYDEKNHEAVLELQKRPTINGGIIAIDKGEVRSVISGFDTLGYNRSMHARKQPGSVFKTLVYFAAMQLGWSMLDQIDNERQLFPFQARFYYPRPDHQTPFRKASMLWAGILSENLASVSLAYRLTDKLNFDQFKELMKFMGYLPNPGEAPKDYHFRVSRSTGVTLDNKGVLEYQLQNAIRDVEPDLAFAGASFLIEQLPRMWWGEGYQSELSNLYKQERDSYSVKELGARLSLVKYNYKRFERLSQDMTSDWNLLTEKFNSLDAEQAFADQNVKAALKKFKVLPSTGNKPTLGYDHEYEGEAIPGSFSANDKFLMEQKVGRELNVVDAQSIWGKGGFFSSNAGIALSDVKLAGNLPMNIFIRIQQSLNNRFDKVINNNDQYDLPRYFNHHDFRVGLGLLYLTKLSKALGINSELQPVLSFPLGANDVTVSEVAKAYQTFIEGKTYTFFDQGLDNQVTFIKKVEDRQGNLLYEAKRKDHQIVVPENALQVREILKKIVTHGTGKRARGELYVELDPSGKPLPRDEEGRLTNKDAKNNMKIRVPAFGKTGTTNDFATSYFAGFVPYPTEKSNTLDPSNSYVIAAYVGFDNNTSMRRGRFKVYGSNGALPLWTDLAKGIIEVKKFDEKLDIDDIKILSTKEWTLKEEKQATPLMVDLPRGLVLRSGGTTDLELWGTSNLAKTGEEFENYFALGSSVQSIVHVPSDTSGGSWQPLQQFSLYRVRPQQGQNTIKPNDSKIEEGLKVSAFPSEGNTIPTSPTEGATPVENIPVPENVPPMVTIDDDEVPNPANNNVNNNDISNNTTKSEKESEKKEVDKKDSKDKSEGYTEEDLW